MTRVFWNIWSSYATFYFGKVNLSIVVPVLLATYGDLSLYSIGFVTTGFMVSYALGQFLHGQISERFNPFVYVVVGLLGSAVMNMFLGFTAGFFWMLLICEIIDGGFQSMGWSSIVRANAYTSEDPEKSSTILGTAYQAGNSLAWVVSGFMIGQFGWEWGFWTAAIVMALRAISLYVTRPKFEFKARKLGERVKLTISFPIFLSAISLCLLNMVRFGVISWIPTYLYREHAMPIEKVGLMPSRFHKESVVASATGFIDGWGYIGSAAIGILVPFILDITGSWNTVFYFWAGLSFAIAGIVLMVYLRRFKEKVW